MFSDYIATIQTDRAIMNPFDSLGEEEYLVPLTITNMEIINVEKENND